MLLTTHTVLLLSEYVGYIGQLYSVNYSTRSDTYPFCYLVAVSSHVCLPFVVFFNTDRRLKWLFCVI